MEQNVAERLASLEQKIDTMHATVEKLRKYFLWTGIITVALFILPLIGLVLVIPSFINSYTHMGSFDQTSSSQLDTLNSLLQ